MGKNYGQSATALIRSKRVDRFGKMVNRLPESGTLLLIQSFRLINPFN